MTKKRFRLRREIHVAVLKGGMGNQFFLYSYYKYLKDFLGFEKVFIDTGYFREEYRRLTQPHIRFNLLDITYDKVPSSLQSLFTSHAACYKLTLKILRVLGLLKIWNDDSVDLLSVNMSVLNFHNAYYQKWKYAEFGKVEIKKAIGRLENTLDKEELNLLMDIRNSKSVSIHIRRGDYLTSPSSVSHHAVCSDEYYIRAIELMRGYYENARFFVFTDDRQWAYEQPWLRGTSYVHVGNVTNSNDKLDLFYMANCQGNIIANSTYSWWAAFANLNAKTIVAAPSKWFQDDVKNESVVEMLPPNWFVI